MILTYKVSLNAFMKVSPPSVRGRSYGKAFGEANPTYSNPRRQHKKRIMDRFKLSGRQFTLWRKGLLMLNEDFKS